MRKITKLSAIVLSLLLLSGCMPEPTVKLDKAGSKIEQDQTSYSSVLRDLNEMIRIFHGRPMNVVVDSIENKTAARSKLPLDITDMVKTSFLKIGDFVNVIYNNNSEGMKDFYMINGAITQYDVIRTQDKGVNAAATGTVNGQRYDSDGSMDSEDQTVKLTLTFNPANAITGNYISRANTNNTVTIEKKSSAKEFAFSILGSGFGYNNAVTKAQGIHASIDVLVELSVVEVLGKLGKFPYWLLLKGGKVNPDIVNELSHKFLRLPLNKKIEQISYLLKLRGKNVAVTSVMNDNLRQAIIEYKKEHGMEADDTITKELYISLLNP